MKKCDSPIRSMYMPTRRNSSEHIQVTFIPFDVQDQLFRFPDQSRSCSKLREKNKTESSIDVNIEKMNAYINLKVSYFIENWKMFLEPNDKKSIQTILLPIGPSSDLYGMGFLWFLAKFTKKLLWIFSWGQYFFLPIDINPSLRTDKIPDFQEVPGEIDHLSAERLSKPKDVAGHWLTSVSNLMNMGQLVSNPRSKSGLAAISDQWFWLSRNIHPAAAILVSWTEKSHCAMVSVQFLDKNSRTRRDMNAWEKWNFIVLHKGVSIFEKLPIGVKPNCFCANKGKHKVVMWLSEWIWMTIQCT